MRPACLWAACLLVGLSWLVSLRLPVLARQQPGWCP